MEIPQGDKLVLNNLVQMLGETKSTACQVTAYIVQGRGQLPTGLTLKRITGSQ